MRKAKTRDLTPRKRAWLAHLQACARTGEPLRGYAKRKGLSEHSLYQAARELRALGAWGPGVSKPRRSAPASFVRVEAPLRAGPESSWRIQLPNGVSLEGMSALEPEGLSSLVEALAAL